MANSVNSENISSSSVALDSLHDELAATHGHSKQAFPPWWISRKNFRTSDKRADCQSATSFVRKISIGYPQLAAMIESDGNFMLFRRFGFLHARLLLQVQERTRALEEQVDLDFPDQEQSIEMNQLGEIVCEERKYLLNLIGQELSEFDDLISRAQRLSEPDRPRDTGTQSVAEWLCKEPSIPPLIQESDLRWPAYVAKVQSMVLDKQHNEWLGYDINNILRFEEHSQKVPRHHRTVWWRRRWRNLRNRRPTQRLIEETLETGDGITSPKWKEKLDRALRTLRQGLYMTLAVLVYSINISSALGYLMLANPPGPQQTSSPDMYWKGTIIAWGATISILLTHGMFFGKYPTESYVRRLGLLGIICCSVIAFALHMLAVNVISGVLVGFTLSVVFIQIW